MAGNSGLTELLRRTLGAVHLRTSSCAPWRRERRGRGAPHVVGPSREEAGCLSIQAFRSARDPRLFYVHPRLVDEAAFDHHAGLPHTVRFIERVQALIDHPLDVTRTRLVV